MMPPMRKSLICTLLGLVALQSAAWATCGLPQPRHVCQEYFANPAVVVARLTRVRHVGAMHPGASDGSYYYMETVERLKGRILNRFQIYEENASGRATFEWKRGESYLLFLTYSEQDHGWELDGCGNSAPLSNAKKVRDEIGRIKAGQQREAIEGFIASEETLPERLTVKIEGAGNTRTVPVENREFRLRVEPGTYVITPVAAGWIFKKDDFSYDDPANLKIEPGRCAQVQFVGSPEAVK